MKLAKKMLACVIALAMVAALALTAFAADTKLSVKPVKSEDGKQVVVTVSATEFAGFKSGSLTINYDHTVLEFVKGAPTVASAMDLITVAAGIPAGMTAEDDTINVGLMCQEEATNADAEIFTLTFNVLKKANSKITVEVLEWDGTDKPADTKAKVTLVAETTTKAPVTTTKAPVTTTEDSSVTPSTKTPTATPPMGDVGVAAVAGVMALAAVAFVATRKKDAE